MLACLQQMKKFVLCLQSMALKWTAEALRSLGKVGRVQDTRELVLHPNYIAIYRIRGSDVQILRIHHAARQA